MNKNTLKLTTGAMFIAIFTMILIVNRQTGMMLEEVILFILPIPMVAFSAKYGFNSGIPVAIGMGLMSFLFGTVTTISYAVTQCIVGLVLGSCLYKRKDPGRTLLLTIGLSVIACIFNMLILTWISGIGVEEDIRTFQSVMRDMFPSYAHGVVMEPGFIIALLILLVVFAGVMQGYVVYILSILVLKKMRFPVERPKTIYEYYPPKWTAPVSVLLFGAGVAAYLMLSGYKILQIGLMLGAILGFFYLFFAGYLAANLAAVLLFRRSALKRLLFIILTLLIYPVLGYLYIITDYHRNVMEGTKR